MSHKSSRVRFAEFRSAMNQTWATGQRPEAADHRERRKRTTSRSFVQLFLEFWTLLHGHRRTILLALLTLTIATLFKLVPPATTKLMFDYVLTPNPLPTFWTQQLGMPSDRFMLLLILAGIIILTSFVAISLGLWSKWNSMKTVARMQVGLRKKVFQHAIRLPLHRVYQLKSGGTVSILREDAGGAAQLVNNMLVNPWSAIVQLVGSFLVLAYVDWRLLVGGLVLIPLIYITHRTWISRIRPLYRELRGQRQEIDGSSTESFSGMRIVRAFSREQSETNRFVRESNLLIRKQLFIWWWAQLIELIWAALIPFASTLLLIYGGYQILHGHMTFGDLTMFLFYLVMLLGPLAALSNSATAFQNNLAGLDRILELLKEPREVQSRQDAVTLVRQQVEGRITFRNVSFRYPGSAEMNLHNVDLDVDPGETIAFVGRSGAGKTTLCNLVARFYDPTSGQVEIDGRNLRDIRVESYRKLLGVVEQDVFLFDGTISDNLRYAQRGATQLEVEKAARAAHAHEFISQLVDGYETLVGERGVRLSGGQKQRLAIARALLADPRIVILDEATSNLDSESEHLIWEALDALLEGRTSFVIAHRMSTVVRANRIAIVEDGRIVKLGPHEQLLSTSPYYRRIVEMQTDGIAAVT